MAKATVTLVCKTCGKEFTTSVIKRNRSEADSWEEWSKKNICECPECYKSRRNAEDLAEAEQILAGVTFAELTGSDKQTRWANAIRAKQIAKLIKQHGQPKPLFWTVVNQLTDAEFWIDNRSDDWAVEKKIRELYAKEAQKCC